MLPSKPKIFHGRDLEVKSIMKILMAHSPRIAILGGGGIGKTSLARAVLHHPDTCAKFDHRFFVSVESARTSVELAALVGLHLGLDPGQNLTKSVVQYFSRKPSSILILDNMETVWEPIYSRNGTEKFLSLLIEVEHLALVITMRGAERPAKVCWTPFLSPLQPLSNYAAQQTFMDITDNAYTVEDINQLLQITDNMPLAVDLIAHLVDYEGLNNVLTRWEMRRHPFSLLGMTGTRIWIPRVTSGSRELLSLLSILPNGLSDAELVQSCLPIANILGCKATLLGYVIGILGWKQATSIIVPIRLSLFCLGSVITDWTQAFLTEALQSRSYNQTSITEQLVTQTILHLPQISDPLLECKFYQAVGENFLYRKLDWGETRKCYGKALELAQLCGDRDQWCNTLLRLAWLERNASNYATAQRHAQDAQRLSKLSGNLYHEARAYWTAAMCSTDLGDYQESMIQLCRAREIITICGPVWQPSWSPNHSEPGRGPSGQVQNMHKRNTSIIKYFKALPLTNMVNVMHRHFSILAQIDIKIERENFDFAKVKFQNVSMLFGEKSSEGQTFCLEKLANIKDWPAFEWHYRWPVSYLVFASKSGEKLAYTQGTPLFSVMYASQQG
ncbi:hypothetical protein B0H14DRAFT_3647334 [Mycena olivaceomarginata]|nr:hypothetical protein B0H14DRAFT_3647334 [Mycena olivaceomarginata]